MKINFEQILSNMRLLLRVCSPATVFIGLCLGIFMAFISLLSTITLTQRDPLVVSGAWLLLLIFYIIFGVAFTRFAAGLIRRSFGSEEWRIQRRMISLSGLPFYAFCLLCLVTSVTAWFDPDGNAPTVFVMGSGFLLLGFASSGYLLLMRLFLGRSNA